MDVPCRASEVRRIAPTLLVALLLALQRSALASSGDESLQFRACVRRCREVDEVDDDVVDAGKDERERGMVVPRCSDGPLAAPSQQLPFSWDCNAECQYRCMWAIESDSRISSPFYRPNKYFGKWPFVRLGPMQEPASVALSLANLVANAHCLARLVGLARPRRGGQSQSQARSKKKQTKEWSVAAAHAWLVHFVLAVNAWLWSAVRVISFGLRPSPFVLRPYLQYQDAPLSCAVRKLKLQVFHSRDLRVTERLDYFSAGAVMVFDVYLSCSRVFRVSNMLVRLVSILMLAFAYGRHMYYMHYFKFDYGYHVGLCVAAGLAQSLLWIGWLLLSEEGRSHPGKRSLWTFVVVVNAAVLLEILDFPPVWDVVDAHALWHLATVPLTYVLWGFVCKDAVV